VNDEIKQMCNLYRLTTTQEATRRLFPDGLTDTVGNLGPLDAIYPDTKAPIVRHGRDGGRELALARFPDDHAERTGRPNPSQGDAGDLDRAGRMGSVID
jgi:hypothetical protein